MPSAGELIICIASWTTSSAQSKFGSAAQAAMTLRRSKIVCTIGPASESAEMIERLLRAGMDVARLNFSHGTHTSHARIIRRLREASGRQEKPLAILADLQGPKIRTGALAGGRPVILRAGQAFTITSANVPGTSERVSTTYGALPREVRRGNRILLADGLIELRVDAVHGREILCRVLNGGELGEHKGINLPGVKLRVPALTAKDRDDLAFALAHGVNYLAVSFVRRPEDVRVAQAAVARAGKTTPVIAKLEKPEAINDLDAILRVADGVMVARGDLGVEMKPEVVPVVQKEIIARARVARRPVITATQMLESMTQNPRPTRAEASDVANAIFDGTDAVMLSAETATGRYPVEAVKMMARIIGEAEKNMRQVPGEPSPGQLDVAETTAELIGHASRELPMKVIAVFTESGSTARLISKYRPRPPIIAFTPDPETRRRLSLLWGVVPRSITRVREIDGLAAIAEKRLLEEELVRPGDVVGIVAGTPLGIRGTTNFMKFHVVRGAAARHKSK
jgi:pyruvate kinase